MANFDRKKAADVPAGPPPMMATVLTGCMDGWDEADDEEEGEEMNGSWSGRWKGSEASEAKSDGDGGGVAIRRDAG